MTLNLSIDSIKGKHTILYEQVVRDGQNTKPDKAILAKVEDLLDQMKLCPLDTLDDYRWLSDAALQWQVVYSSQWNIAKLVEIKSPPPTVLPQLLPSDKNLSDEELENWQRSHAQYLGLLRRAQQRRRSTDSEMAWDWHQAEVLLVSGILDGFPNFAGRISSDSYWRLEEVWLREVKRIRAYFIWEREGKAVFDLAAEKEHYSRASEHIRDMLVNPKIKAQAIEFAPVKAYLESRYLTAGRVQPHSKRSAGVLIENKARRIKEVRDVEESYFPGQTDVDNWIQAETYVNLFYGNIIAAVLEKDEMSVLRVLKAFQYSKAPENCWWVINCFETALAIYFLDPEIISVLWSDFQTDEIPSSYIDSRVVVSQFPPNFNVPAICRDSFAFNSSEITFRGIMTDEQKEALCKELKEESYRKEIEILCRRSRLMPKKTTL